MTPRAASLRVAHQARCPHENKTALASLKTCGDDCSPACRGCSCKTPAYYVLWRDRSGATRKSSRVRDRRLADKMLREQQVEIDKGNVGYSEQKTIALPAWIAEWEAILERRNVKGTTRRAYMQTVNLAADAIGHAPLRQIGPAELRRFHDRIKDTTHATQSKHFTHLGACFSSAVDEGYLDRNPVTAFKKSLRLRSDSGTPPYTDGELERLHAAMVDEEDVYRAIVRALVATGARAGELVALDWRDVNLAEKTLRVRHTYNPVDGLTAPKDRDERTVYLTPEAETVFADWMKGKAVQTDGIVFPAPRSGGYVNLDYLRKIVAAAAKTAGIDKADERTGRPRKPLHSLRATFARRQLETGKHPQWVEAQLGHSSLTLTINTYGAWSDEAMRHEATKTTADN